MAAEIQGSSWSTLPTCWTSGSCIISATSHRRVPMVRLELGESEVFVDRILLREWRLGHWPEKSGKVGKSLEKVWKSLENWRLSGLKLAYLQPCPADSTHPQSHRFWICWINTDPSLMVGSSAMRLNSSWQIWASQITHNLHGPKNAQSGLVTGWAQLRGSMAPGLGNHICHSSQCDVPACSSQPLQAYPAESSEWTLDRNVPADRWLHEMIDRAKPIAYPSACALECRWLHRSSKPELARTLVLRGLWWSTLAPTCPNNFEENLLRLQHVLHLHFLFLHRKILNSPGLKNCEKLLLTSSAVENPPDPPLIPMIPSFAAPLGSKILRISQFFSTP